MHVSISYNVEAEHEWLSNALTRLHEQETMADQAEAALDLLESIDHAERALTVLLLQAESADTTFQVRVCGLRTLTFVAYDAIRRVYNDARNILNEKGTLPRPLKLLDTEFSEGTILSCPKTDCGQGLYKIMERCTTADLVMDEGQFLSPLNRTIPPRGAWQGLSCVFCGSRVFQGGQIHTFQHGWR